MLRVTRLVRLGKLLKKFPDIWKQIKAIGKSISAVGALMTLIILFMFIFMILGMNIFGGILTMEYDAGEL
ncbi:MAG: ion transporter, partial [bacterium]